MSIDHPNLSKEINDNIAKSEFLGGKDVKDIENGGVLQVQTKNTLYTIHRQDSGQLFISGGHRFPQFTPVSIHGSTFGGSMIKVGFIGIGMYLEFSIIGPGNQRMTFTTSQIKEII